VLIPISIAFLLGCEKTETSLLSNNSDVKVIRIDNASKTGTTMLSFSSSKAFDSTLHVLDSLVEFQEDNFISQYGHLSDSLLNDMEDQLNYDDQAPMENFESQLGFSNSLRNVFNSLEAIWLSDTARTLASHPVSQYPLSGAEMTLLNSSGEVMIGDTILKISLNGYIAFTDGDFNKLNQFNNGDSSILSHSSVIYHFRDWFSDCEPWIWSNSQLIVNSNKLLVMVLTFHAYPWKSVSAATILSYKKLIGNLYRSYRTSLGVCNTSLFYDEMCLWDEAGGCSMWKTKKRTKYSRYVADWGDYPNHRAKNGKSITGEFEFYNTYAARSLVW
jgi:hypothetical protein